VCGNRVEPRHNTPADMEERCEMNHSIVRFMMRQPTITIQEEGIERLEELGHVRHFLDLVALHLIAAEV